MNHLPTTKQLRYFVALEQYGHFGKAAEACFVSQPAFSVAIRELENTLNIQLVDRTNKNVTVTSLGRDIATQARQVLRDRRPAEGEWPSQHIPTRLAEVRATYAEILEHEVGNS